MNSLSSTALAADIVALHDAYHQTAGWPDVADFTPAKPLAWGAQLQAAVLDNHHFNARLWREEDLARRQLAPDHEIVRNKRHIDAFNQARNNAIEHMDEWLLLALGLVDPATVTSPAPASRMAPGARLNSETAGSMIDRLSIVSLKIRAMAQQTTRSDVEAVHRLDAQARLHRLQEQRQDLCHCLDTLLADCSAGHAYFKVYRQFKMYNDPAYNAALVQERRQQAGGEG